LLFALELPIQKALTVFQCCHLRLQRLSCLLRLDALFYAGLDLKRVLFKFRKLLNKFLFLCDEHFAALVRLIKLVLGALEMGLELPSLLHQLVLLEIRPRILLNCLLHPRPQPLQLSLQRP